MVILYMTITLARVPIKQAQKSTILILRDLNMGKVIKIVANAYIIPKKDIYTVF